MATFENGVKFLSLNQYDAAIYCFHYILGQFPDCYEANLNIGYAALMKYLESFDKDNFWNLNTGVFISGNYYKNSPSLKSRIRGADEDLWWIAVGEFQAALRIKPNLTMAKANLGLAYLVSPNPRSTVGKAARFFAEALELAQIDTTIDDADRAVINMNAGLACFDSDTSVVLAESYFNAAEAAARKFAELQNSSAAQLYNETDYALLFNKALLIKKIGGSENIVEALKLFSVFLEKFDCESPWWDIGFKHYLDLCTDLSVEADTAMKARSMKKSKGDFKKVVKIETNDNKLILLSERKDEFVLKFKKYNISEHLLIPGKNLKKLKINDAGIDLLASDFIFAIILNKDNSPKVVLEKFNRGYSTRLFVGMAIKDFEQAVGNSKYIDKTGLINNSENYRYYFNLGLAVLYDNKARTIKELVIVQL
jgi:hypothetical protein